MSVMLALLLSASFDVKTIPLPGPASAVYFGPSQHEAVQEILVLDGRTLMVHPLADVSHPRRVDLPGDATAFDVADIDGDRQDEVIAVAGRRVVRVDYAKNDPTGAGKTLFSAGGLLAEDQSQPYLHPLVFSLSGLRCIALPEGRELVLYTPDGEPVRRSPLWSEDPREAWWPQTFNAFSFDETQAGPKGGLEWWVWRKVELDPQLPAEAQAIGAAARLPHGNPAAYARNNSDTPVHTWVWFPVRESEGETIRAYFSLSGKREQNTSIAVVKTSRDASAEDLGAEPRILRYPGVAISSWDPSDFNGDGFRDLLFFKAPEPGGSVESIVQTASSGTIPLMLTIHLFDPARQRFEPRPASVLDYRVSVYCLLGKDPIDAVVARDFNGDGRSDLALAANGDRFDLWLSGVEGLTRKPVFSKSFPEAVQVFFEEDLEGKGYWSVGLRSDKALYVITYTGD